MYVLCDCSFVYCSCFECVCVCVCKTRDQIQDVFFQCPSSRGSCPIRQGERFAHETVACAIQVAAFCLQGYPWYMKWPFCVRVCVFYCPDVNFPMENFSHFPKGSQLWPSCGRYSVLILNIGGISTEFWQDFFPLLSVFTPVAHGTSVCLLIQRTRHCSDPTTLRLMTGGRRLVSNYYYYLLKAYSPVNHTGSPQGFSLN